MTKAKDDLTIGEKLYTVLEDLKDYSMHLDSNSKESKEIDWIIDQIEEVKSILEKKQLNTIKGDE